MLGRWLTATPADECNLTQSGLWIGPAQPAVAGTLAAQLGGRGLAARLARGGLGFVLCLLLLGDAAALGLLLLHFLALRSDFSGPALLFLGAALGLGLVLAQTAKPPEPVVAPPKRGRPVKEKVVPIQPAS